MPPQSEAPAPDAARGLQITHRCVLILLALTGTGLLLGDFDAPPPAPDPGATTAGIGLALAAIALRRFASSPALAPTTAVFLSLGALVSAAGLGLLGVLIALQTDSRETGLFFTLAGLIFALRRPAPATPPIAH
jgi:hypothetical protein